MLQVKTMSSHQCRGRHEAVEQQRAASGRPVDDVAPSGSPQSGQVVSMRPSTCRAAQIPKASQAQFAYQRRPAA